MTCAAATADGGPRAGAVPVARAARRRAGLQNGRSGGHARHRPPHRVARPRAGLSAAASPERIAGNGGQAPCPAGSSPARGGWAASTERRPGDPSARPARRDRRDPNRTLRKPAPVRVDRTVQRLRQPADADRTAVHAPGLRPGADVALGGHPGRAGRHRLLPVPDDGTARPRTLPGPGPGRGPVPGSHGCPRGGCDPDPGGTLAPRTFRTGDGTRRSGVDAALRFGAGAVRLLRCALDAGVPVRAVHLSLAAGRACGHLRAAAGGAGADELRRDGTSPGGGGRDGDTGRTSRAAASRGRRDGARARHAGGRRRRGRAGCAAPP